jgi:phage gp46-like protein
MSQVLLVFDNATQESDLVLDSRGCIPLEGGIETTTLISTLTNRRARPSDKVSSKEGWWGDLLADWPGDQIGSLLWLLAREVITPGTIRKMGLYTESANSWHVTDGLASGIAIEVERYDMEAIACRVVVKRPNDGAFSIIWNVYRTSFGGSF